MQAGGDGLSSTGRHPAHLVESIVNAVLIVIPQIFAKKLSQMSLVQRDDAVQHLSAATSNPTFRKFRFARVPGCSCALAVDRLRI